MIATGNVKICRIWDAHAEAPVLDMELDTKKEGPVMLLDADIDRNQLVAIGEFTDQNWSLCERFWRS